MTINTTGEAIRFLLKRNSLSLDEVATKAKIRLNTLKDAISGATNTRASTRKKIINAFEITVEEFIRVEESINVGKDPREVFKTPASSDEFEALTELLNETNSRLQKFSDSASAPKQPIINSGLIDDKMALFYFGARNFDFLDRQKEHKQLVEFALSGSPRLTWTVISGQAGAGKSRLAMETALTLAEEHGWLAGFLEDFDSFNWAEWCPNAPTLMIVDYAASRIDDVRMMIRGIVTGQTSHICMLPIRLILIERNADAITEPLLLESRGTISAYTSFSKLKITISGLKTPFNLVELICKQFGKDVSGDLKARRRYKNFDPTGRPLFAMLFAYSLLDEELIDADLITVCRKILKRWETKFWSLADLKLQDRLLLALATILDGVSIEELKLLAALPVNPMQNINAGLIRAGLSKLSSQISPIEPDLLGELFVLDQFSSNEIDPGYILQLISKLQEENEALTKQFLKRAVADFPSHDAIRLFVDPHLDTSRRSKTIRADLLVAMPPFYLQEHVSKEDIQLSLERANKPSVSYFPRQGLPVMLGLEQQVLKEIARSKIDHFSTFFYDSHLIALNGFVWKFFQSGHGGVVNEVLNRLLSIDILRFSEFLLSSPAEQVFSFLETCRQNEQLQYANQIEQIIFRNAKSYIEYGFSYHPSTIETICRVSFTNTHAYLLSSQLIAELKRAMIAVEVEILLQPAETQAATPYKFLSIIAQHEASVLQRWADVLFAQDTSDLGLSADLLELGCYDELIEALSQKARPQIMHPNWRALLCTQ